MTCARYSVFRVGVLIERESTEPADGHENQGETAPCFGGPGAGNLLRRFPEKGDSHPHVH